MNTTSLTSVRVLALLVPALLTTINNQLSASPAGTAFTYQGKLSSGANAANGIYDFRFSIWDAAANGNPDSAELEVTSVVVTNGVFTVVLDPGAGVFTGDARWLEIGVRTNGSGAFRTLPVRQALSPAPYALYAPNAGFATAATIAHMVAGAAVWGTNIAPGQVVKSLNGLQDGVTLVAGANITLGTNGNTLTLAAAGGGATGGWSTTGNAGTSTSTNFLGTTDNQPLELKVNGQRVLRLEPAANGGPNVIAGFSGNQVTSGVGGATIAGGGARAAPNQVSGPGGTVGGGGENQALGMVATVGGGQANVAGGSGATVGGGGGNAVQTNADFGTIPGGTLNRVGAPYGFAAGRRAKANHDGAFVWADSTDADFASTGANQFLIRAAGGVGIGTSNPGGAMLNVAGPVRATAFQGDGSGLTSLNVGSLAGTITNTLTFNPPGSGPPFIAANQNVATGLNADFLDGWHGDHYWQVGGNGGVGQGDFLGTTDNRPLELRVNGQRALRLEPDTNVLSCAPNVIGGYGGNFVGAGIMGATIAGGGRIQYGLSLPSTNAVSGPFGVVGGGGETGFSITPLRRLTSAGGSGIRFNSALKRP